jgi:hypothetical protein
MARKTLLTESELRRFMKLADMRPAGEKRIQEMGVPYGDREEEDEIDDLEGDLDADDDVEAELGGELDMADDELAVDDELPGEPMDAPAADADVEAKFAEFMQQVAGVARDVLGIEVDVEESGDMGDDLGGEEVAMGDEVEMDPMGPEGGEEELAMADVEVSPEGGEEEEEVVADLMEDEEDIVAEITKRVAARLQQENKQAQMVDELAERIMKRLTK